MPAEEVTSINNAMNLLAEGLITKQGRTQIGSFWEFVRDIWSQSYDHPEYFQAWHVGVLAEDIEECVDVICEYLAKVSL